MLRRLCRALVPVLCLALGVVGLVGCGSGGGTTEATPPEESVEPQLPSESGKPAPRAPRPIVAGEVHPIPGAPGAAWAAGDAPLLLTANGGRSWRRAGPLDVPEYVGSLFADRGHGWVATRGASRSTHLGILWTTDGGFEWARAFVAGSKQASIGGVSLSFPTDAVGYAEVTPEYSGVVPSGTLYRTVDGGRRWVDVGPTKIAGEVEFTDARHGWLLGTDATTLLSTADGGVHWSRVTAPPPTGDVGRRRRYVLPIRLAGGLTVLPVLLEGTPTRFAFYRQRANGWALAAVTDLRGTIAGGSGNAVAPLPPRGVVVRDPGSHALTAIEFPACGGATRRTIPARGLPEGGGVTFADRRHAVANPCYECRPNGDQPYFSGDGGRTFQRRPVVVRRRATLEVLPRCPPGKLLVYSEGARGAALGTVYSHLTVLNLSGRVCKLAGIPSAVAVGVGGQPIGGSARRSRITKPTHRDPHRVVVLLPKEKAAVEMSWGDALNTPRSRCHPRLAAGVRVTLPGAKRPQTVAMPFERCALPPGGRGLDIGPIEAEEPPE